LILRALEDPIEIETSSDLRLIAGSASGSIAIRSSNTNHSDFQNPQFLTVDAGGTLGISPGTGTGGTTVPGGADGDVQFKTGTSFVGSANFN
jgi:hypothetical protein